jgi:hypothetical protein
MGAWKTILWLLRVLVIPKSRLAIENLALRQQLAVYNQSVKRPRLRARDRVFWVWLSKFWSEWSSALVVVKPEYYHQARTHLSLDRNSPTPRTVQPPSLGEVISISQVGGLHHRYARAA